MHRRSSAEPDSAFAGRFIESPHAPGGEFQSESGRSMDISPRKLKALYKMALAHGVITDDSFADRRMRKS